LIPDVLLIVRGAVLVASAADVGLAKGLEEGWATDFITGGSCERSPWNEIKNTKYYTVN